jgi:hypothetical protein
MQISTEAARGAAPRERKNILRIERRPQSGQFKEASHHFSSSELSV